MWRYILAAAITAVIMIAIYGPRSGRASPSHFEWSGAVASAGWVNVRNTNGTVRVEPAEHDSVEVEARISGRRSGNTRVVVNEHDGNLYICPVVGSRGRCGPGGYSPGRARGLARLFGRGSNARVDVTVRVPDGVNADASTTNGTLYMSGVHGEAQARTVNGRIQLDDIFGPVTARSTNGSIRARLDSVPANVALNFRTTNGSVTAELPESFSGDVDLSTTNGRIHSQFPVIAGGGEISPRRFRGRIGEGGRELSMRTTNGSITLRPVGLEVDSHGTHEGDFEAHIERAVEEAMKKVEIMVDTITSRTSAPRPPAPPAKVRVAPREVTVSP